MSNSLAAAIVNWVWLAELPAQGTVVAVGDNSPNLLRGLEKHFLSVAVHHPTDRVGSWPFEPGSADCVVLDAELGEAVVATDDGASALLQEAKRVLRNNGCLFVPIAHLRRRTPRTLVRSLHASGFVNVKPFYVFESLERPNTLIPAGRRATSFFEAWAWGGWGGRIKSAIAMAGSHHLTQPALFLLAYP